MNLTRKHSGTGCLNVLDNNPTRATDVVRWAGIGTDPLGGTGVAYLPVPEEPTTSPRNRYFGHLSTIFVPDFYVGQLVGLRQSIVIGTRRQADLDSEAVYTEQEQLSPFWSFPDGNVTWFVTWTPGRPRQPFAPPPTALGENFSTDLLITHAAWLAKSVGPYVPLNGGMPPGSMVAQYDVLTSLLFQYRTQGFSFYEGSPAIGPGRYDLFVSVQQTNPARNRGNQPNPAPVPTRIEDIFVRDNPLARYMSVAGDLAVRRVPFSVMRSTAQDRWASSEERTFAKYFLEQMVEQAKAIVADKKAPPMVRTEARTILKEFALARDPRNLSPMEAYINANKGRIIRKKTKLLYP